MSELVVEFHGGKYLISEVSDGVLVGNGSKMHKATQGGIVNEGSRLALPPQNAIQLINQVIESKDIFTIAFMFNMGVVIGVNQGILGIIMNEPENIGDFTIAITS